MNYQKVLDEILVNIQSSNKTPKLLLHACCGPCSSYVIEYLSNYFEITILYYNPNIYPEEEYNRRLGELKTFLPKRSYKNKIDLIEKEKLLSLIEMYTKEYPFEAVIPISSLKEKYREVILQEIEKNLKEGPAYYDTEEYTDQTMQQLVEEIIREKALKLLRDEVPHGILVEVEKMKRRKTIKGEPIFNVEATIYCSRESHKAIIIGKNGEMLKKISTYAREDLEKMLDVKVNLQLWVKVREDWQNDTSLLKKFKLQ